MSPTPALSKLWPVVMVLVVLLAGTLGLQIYAQSHVGQALVIAIHSEAPTARTVAEDQDDDSDSPIELDKPANADHATAREAARRGEVNVALGLYKKAVDADPQDGMLRSEYGYWLLSNRRIPEALAELDKAAKDLPDEPRIALYAGMALRKSGNDKSAESEFRRALALRPGFGSALLSLGRLLNTRGEHEEAIRLLEQASRSGGNEQRARASTILGHALLDAGKSVEAERAFSAAINWAPAQAEIRVAAARAYLDHGGAKSNSRALDLATRAVELAPDLPQVYVVLGEARAAAKDLDGAEAAFERALHIDPTYATARRKLLRLALERRDYSRAQAQVEILLAGDDTQPEHYFLAGLVASRSGRDDDARASYRNAIAKAEGFYPEAYLNIGLIEKEANNLDAAISAYETALKQKPDYLAALNNLGLVFAAAEREKDAENAYRRAISVDANYVSAWLNLGKLLSKEQRFEEAIAIFNRVLTIKPNYPHALLNLGVTQKRAGKIEDAIATYKRLIEVEPRYVAAHFNLGLALESANRIQDAADAYRRAVAVDSEHVASLKRLSAVQMMLGSLDDARSILESAVAIEPADSDLRLKLANIARRQGDVAACEREAKIAEKLATTNTAATAMLKRCSDSSISFEE